MKVILEFESEEEFREYKYKLAGKRKFDPGSFHINILQISNAIKRRLVAANKNLVRDISSMTNIELYRLPGISWQSVAEIVAAQLLLTNTSLKITFTD